MAAEGIGHRTRWLVVTLGTCAIVLFTIFVVEQLWLQPVQVVGRSMVPTLEPGQRMLVDTRVDFADLRRGDIVVFAVREQAAKRAPFIGTPLTLADRRRTFVSPDSSDARLVTKRIIARRGETIQAYSGFIALDSTTKLDEPWLPKSQRSVQITVPPIMLRRDELYVLGDNRERSVDSRTYGPVPEWAVLGRVSTVIWPPSAWGSDLR